MYDNEYIIIDLDNISDNSDFYDINSNNSNDSDIDLYDNNIDDNIDNNIDNNIGSNIGSNIKYNKYSIGTIYELVCKDKIITDKYIGSTKIYNQCKWKHKNNYNNSKKYNLKLYKFIRNHGGWDNWEMNIINIYYNIYKEDLYDRKTYYITKLNATLNIYIQPKLLV